MTKLYASRDIIGLKSHYTDHVQAMTAEGLHEKSNIAAELAFRDQELVAARTEIERLKAMVDAANHLIAQAADEASELDRHRVGQ